MKIFYVLTKYVQSRLLQNCRMRERVKSPLSSILIWLTVKTCPLVIGIMIRADTRENQQYGLCVIHRPRSACAVQSAHAIPDRHIPSQGDRCRVMIPETEKTTGDETCQSE